MQDRGQLSVHELANELNISRQYIHRILLEMEEKDVVMKLGMAPKVYYALKQTPVEDLQEIIPYEKEKFLKDHFLLIDALGNVLEGIDAMCYWCEKQQLKLPKTIDEYISTRQKNLSYVDEQGFISGLEKLRHTKGMEGIGVDQLFYLDFYTIERFGKTRLGTLMHYAKQGQNKMLMKQIVSEIKYRIYHLIQHLQIDAVAFVPPTIDRKIQIMTELQKLLAIPLPQVKIEKIKTPIVIPQKALSKIFERVANAKNTFVIPEQKHFEHLLIIDDAVGSGATINEIALKIKAKGIAKKITGLAITGRYKGFEVISEL